MVVDVAYLQESSQSPLTSPVVDVPVASHPGQMSPVSTEKRKNYVILSLSPSIYHFSIYCHDCYRDYMLEGESLRAWVKLDSSLNMVSGYMYTHTSTQHSSTHTTYPIATSHHGLERACGRCAYREALMVHGAHPVRKAVSLMYCNYANESSHCAFFYEYTLYLLSQRILKEDEEIEQERIKKTLDWQFHKQHQSFQSMEEQTYTMRAGTLSRQTTNPQGIHKHSLPAEYFHEHHPATSGFAAQPPGAQPYIGPALSRQNNNQPPLQQPPPVEHPPSGFAAQLNASHGAQLCIGAAFIQQNDNQPPPPHPPKPSPTSPTMSPSGSWRHWKTSRRQGRRPLAIPPDSQQIPGNTHLGAPGIPPTTQTPPVHLRDESRPLSSQIPPQYYGGTNVPPEKPLLKRHSISVGGEFEERMFEPLDQQANETQVSANEPSSPHEHFRSPSEEQCSTDESCLSVPLPNMVPIGPKTSQYHKQFELGESYEGTNRHNHHDVKSAISYSCSTIV